jgi:hypothetical protein
MNFPRHFHCATPVRAFARIQAFVPPGRKDADLPPPRPSVASTPLIRPDCGVGSALNRQGTAMVDAWTWGLIIMVAALLGACAGSQVESPPSLINNPAYEPTPPGYQLSPKERGYSCNKITGLMQVRILQIRGYGPEDKGSLAARGVQSVTTPIFGGTTVGIDPDGQYARDVAMLQAYNNLLAQKQCKTFDLKAELNRPGSNATPTPGGASN